MAEPSPDDCPYRGRWSRPPSPYGRRSLSPHQDRPSTRDASRGGEHPSSSSTGVTTLSAHQKETQRDPPEAQRRKSSGQSEAHFMLPVRRQSSDIPWSSSKVWMSEAYKNKRRVQEPTSGQSGFQEGPLQRATDKLPPAQRLNNATSFSKTVEAVRKCSLPNNNISPTVNAGTDGILTTASINDLSVQNKSIQKASVKRSAVSRALSYPMANSKSNFATGKPDESSKSGPQPTMQSDVTSVRERGPTMEESFKHSPRKFHDILGAFFQNSLRLVEAQKDKERAAAMFENRLKDLRACTNNEDSARQAAEELSRNDHGSKSTLDRNADLSRLEDQNKAIAQEFSNLIESHPLKDDANTLKSMKEQVLSLQSENRVQREHNQKLEARLLALESAAKPSPGRIQDFPELLKDIAQIKSNIFVLQSSKDSLEPRIQKMEASMRQNNSLLESMSSNLEKSQEQMDPFQTSLEQCKDELKNVNGLIDRSKADQQQMKEAQTQLENKGAEIELRLDERINVLQKNIALAREEMQTLAKSMDSDTINEANRDALSKMEDAISEKFSSRLGVQERTAGILIESNGRFQTALEAHKTQSADALSQMNIKIQNIKSAQLKLQESVQRQINNVNSTAAPSTPLILRSNTSQPPESAVIHHQSTEMSPPQLPAPAPSPNSHPSTPTLPPTNPTTVASSGQPPNPQSGLPQAQPSSAWQVKTVSQPNPHLDSWRREYSTRIQALEQFVSMHEQRLNFTTLESIWPSFTRFTKDHMDQHYRYPEQVARDLNKLEKKAQVFGKALEGLLTKLQSLSDPHPKTMFDSLKTDIQELKAKATLVQENMNTEIYKVVNYVVEKAMESMKSHHESLEERMMTSLTMLERSAQQASTALSNGASSDPRPDDVLAKMDTLKADFQDLDQNCGRDIATLYGMVADLDSIVKTKTEPSSVDIHPSGVESRRRLVHQSVRTHRKDRPDEGSSSESLIQSRRERKRKRAEVAGSEEL